MKTLEEMCTVLNRLLALDADAADSLLRLKAQCSPASWPALLADPDITVHLDHSGVEITPLLLLNSLVSEQRVDGEYSIFRDVDESGATVNFFVAKVSRSSSDHPCPQAGGGA